MRSFWYSNQIRHDTISSYWLKSELDQLGCATFFETMPDSVMARAKYWLPFLKDHAKVGEYDILVGWSSGATAAMRYAEQNKIAGSVLIAHSYTDLGDDLEKQSGYFDKPWNWKDIQANQAKTALVYSDDDPLVQQAEFEHIAAELPPAGILLSRIPCRKCWNVLGGIY